MQVELSESTAQALQFQAAAHGCTVTEYVEHVLSRCAAASIDRPQSAEPFHILTHEDAIAWILSQNPKLANQSHTETDWQALKSEGRRF